MRGPIINNSDHGQAVYDPFLGSGTTLIAAETTGRICLATELDPLYVDVAVKRWQAFTGKAAALAADGRSFEAVAAERLAARSSDPATSASADQKPTAALSEAGDGVHEEES